ncbi:MAG: pyridoxal 5'-phosphate synthase glutaminase subunit PdxT [Erysipelotrichia bacterium]|jgi:5'-phosphate synthase pdxT subunit|nr:pyridoxal 5'-phosphate synthase glutaminase subunit PdxT [Erysipelotrichia bacterium]
MVIGVLAIQGAFREHMDVLKRLGVEGRLIKKVSDLEGINGIILPGGESTAMAKQMKENGLFEALQILINQGCPVMGTCAGLILLSKEITNQPVSTLGVMDIRVKRNAYGRQLDSFATQSSIKYISNTPLELVFIRAPYIEEVGEGVEVLCEVDGHIVVALQKNMLALAFHPELTGIDDVHQFFIQHMIKKESKDHGSISYP